MALVNQGGKLLLKNGVLATGQACCCGGGGGGEPCDPCSGSFWFSMSRFPDARMVGTWDTGFGDGPVAFDWLAPAGPYVWLNVGWENNSRPPVGMAVMAPFVDIHASLWRWDGTTETCNIYVDGEIAEGEVPALRTCGVDFGCQAHGAYANGFLLLREYAELLANPPPSDNQWYLFLWIYAIYSSMDLDEPDAWYWAWVPACDLPCGEEVSLTSGVRATVPPSPPGLLDIDTFTLTCEMPAPCCTGNAEYPVFELPSVCAAQGGHSFAAHFDAPSSPNDPPPCLGACCYNDGTADVCTPPYGMGFGSWTLAQCNALGGTWHSGQDCETDDPCNLFP